jgi:hypothetical protein
MNSRLSRIIAFILIQCQFSILLPAEELRTDLRRGMSRLEHYLDRAAAERRARDWEQLARAGLEAAMSEWESGALWLLEQDRDAWQEEQRRAEQDYRRETEAAYVRWASERVYNERAALEGSGLEALLRQAASDWGYGDSGRIVSLSDAGGARAAWELLAGGIVDRYIEGWEEQQGLAYAELESRFRDLGLSGEERRALIRGVAEEHRAMMNREYQRIALAEGNRLMAELLYDQGSMKKLAAGEAAAVIARELAREAEEAAGERARELFAKLDASFSAEEEPGIEIAGEDWLNQFRGAFEEGLARWEEAELGFLAARAEWEHDAEDAYLAGEESWNNAYLELTNRQKAWEAAILLKLDEGFAKWQENQSRLSTEIEIARNEFLAASEENRRVKEKMLDSQAEIYVRSRRMMDMVRQGIESWYDLWNEKYLMVYTLIKQAAAREAQSPSGESLALRFKGLDENIYKEFFNSSIDIDELTNPDKNNAALLRNQIELLKDAVLALKERNWSLPASAADLVSAAGDLLDGETGWLSLALRYREYTDAAALRLYRLTGNGGDHIEGYTGELGTELIKAEALLSYWDDELEVAEALDKYAQETSSILEDAARTREELEKASLDYEESVKQYEASLESLAEKGRALDAAQEGLERAKAALAALRGTAEAAQGDYADILAAIKEMNPAMIYDELANLSLSILDFWEGKTAPGGEEAGGKTVEESALAYYRLFHEYTDILRSLEINSLLESLESGSGLGQPSISGLEAKAEEARLLSRSGREEDLRAAAGLYPAEISLSVLWGPETVLFEDGRELLAALDQAYRASTASGEREALLALMRRVWEEAAEWYEGEVLLRRRSAEYLKTGVLAETGGVPGEAELRVRLEGILAALDHSLAVESQEGFGVLKAQIESILTLGPEEMAEAVEEAGGDPLFAAAMEGLLPLSAGAYTAAWLARRRAERDLGLFDQEQARLITERYGAYASGDMNRQNREAREAVTAFIAAFTGESRDTAGREGALEYAAELRGLEQGLNQLGREALDDYIAAFLEYAAVRDCLADPSAEPDLPRLAAVYSAAGEAYEAFASWHYKIYDSAGLAEIAGSAEFSLLSEEDRDEFSLCAAAGDYAGLDAWAVRITGEAYKDLQAKADALVYGRYYQMEKENSRFGWTAGLAACKEEFSEQGIGNETLEKIDSLFDPGVRGRALDALKSKALWRGAWFTGGDGWDYTQYREDAGEAGAELARAALEEAWNEYQAGLILDNQLYSLVNQGLDRLWYISKGGQELNNLRDEKKAALDKALADYNGYLDKDYDQAVNNLDQSFLDYNAAVDMAEGYYREMAAARLELRKRREIEDWASSVYLKDFGTNNQEDYLSPLEKLSQVRYARERAQIAVDVLKEILAGAPRTDAQYGQAMESYKESRRSYYLAQAAAYEGGLALARQQAIVREAELAEEAARRKLITKADPFVPGDYDLVNLTGDGSGGYRVGLAYTLKEISVSDISSSFDPDISNIWQVYLSGAAVRKTGGKSDPELVNAYFGDDKAVLVERVGAKEYMSMAEYEAGEWLKRMGAMGVAYYDDVMLASLYIKYCATEGSEEGKAWFKGTSDPRSGGNYTLGDIPLDTSIRGLNLRAEYNSARRNALQDAYNRVMARGGEEDIARYLLYRDTNLIGNAADYEENLLKSRAMAAVENAAGKTHRNYSVAFGVALGLGAALTATGTVLLITAFFNPGNYVLAAVAFTAAAAAFVVAGTLDYARGQIDSIRNGVRGLLAGVNQNLDGGNGYNTKFRNNYGEWEKSLAYLSQERKVLNLMMFGAEEKPANLGEDPELSYDNFCTGLFTLFNTGPARTAVSYEDSIGLYTGELYDRSGAKAGSTVAGAFTLLNAALEKEAAGRMENLEAESERLKAGQNESAGLYNAAMASALVIPPDGQAELRALALRAGDPSLDIAERRLAGLEYERLAGELSQKTGSSREEISALLARAYGDDAWNSEWHAANLIGLEGELFDSQTLRNRPAETYTENEIVLLRDAALAAVDRNSALELSVKEREWALVMSDFLNQYAAWRDQAEQIRQAGFSEWEKARARMNEEYSIWRRKFDDEYQAKTGAWDFSYLEFVNEKQRWIDDQYLYAVNAGNAGLFDYTGTDAALVIGQALARISVERMDRETIDPALYTDMLLEDSILGELLSRAEGLDGRRELGNPVVRTGVRRTGAAKDLAQAAKVLDLMNSDMQKAAAALAAQEAQKIIEEAIRQFWGRLESENRAVWEWEERLVQANGYRSDGEIRRQAIVDSTVFGTITRTQTVHRYQYYQPNSAPLSDVDLSTAATQDLDADAIMRLVQSARWTLDKWGETIFGRLDNSGIIIEHRIPRGYGELSASGYAATASSEKGRVSALTAEMKKFETRGFEALSDEEKKEYEKLANQLITVRDGELGAHIGYGPVLKDEVDYRHSPIEDALDRGAGEMGKIMLDFLWNSRISVVGYAESFKAFYDQKFWTEDTVPWLKSFTIRDIVSTAANIGGMAIHPLVGFVDDILFAGLDLGVGYRSPEEVMKTLAMTAATTALSYTTASPAGLNIFKNIKADFLKDPLAKLFGKEVTETLFKSLGTAVSSYTVNAAMNAAQAYDFKTGTFNTDEFLKSLYSAKTFSSVASSFVGTGLGDLTSGAMSAADKKLIGGFVNLGVAGYSEAARYGVYALDSMINGSGNFTDRLRQAYGNMGGVTLNIANLGSMLDLMGTLNYRFSENYNTSLGDLGRRLAGAGLLELNLGPGDFSLSLGSDGIDVAGNLYNSAKYGLDYAALKYGSYEAGNNRQLLIKNYLYGDWKAENTSMRIGAGRDKLLVDSEGTLLSSGTLGHTTRQHGAAGRLIAIADMGDVNTNALILQHESYRDGYVRSDNQMETVAAVLAHTRMADLMLRDGLGLPVNSTLLKDLSAYYRSQGDMASFARYALENYDATGDYWRLTNEGNLQYDGHATLRDENGDVIISNIEMGLNDTAVEGALLYILGIDPKDSDKVAAVHSMMKNSGLIHSDDEDPSNWYWTGQHSAILPKVITPQNSRGIFQNPDPQFWSEGRGGIMILGEVMADLTSLNMDKIITLESIADLYNEIGSSGSVISGFIDNTYISAIKFLNYADEGGKTYLATAMLSKYLDPGQLEKVKVNQRFYNALRNRPQNIETSMFTGVVTEEQNFGITSSFIELVQKAETDPYYLVEDHPAIDFAGKGETITTPGGYWVYEGTNRYNAIFSLYGSDLRMRINHVNTDAITHKPGDIIGDAAGSAKLLDYPDKLYGTGSDIHVHIEYTLNLPFNGVYTRQYVDPNTLKPSPRYLDYNLYYFDKDKKEISRTVYNRRF